MEFTPILFFKSECNKYTICLIQNKYVEPKNFNNSKIYMIINNISIFFNEGVQGKELNSHVLTAHSFQAYRKVKLVLTKAYRNLNVTI